MLPRLFILLHLLLLNSIASFAADASAVAVEPVVEDPIVVPDFSTLAGYPAGEDAVGADILRRLYVALIDYKLETDILSPRKAQLALAKDALQEEYKAHAASTSLDLEVDATFQDPVIFDSITELANAAVKHEKIARKKAFILQHRTTVDVEALEDQALHRLYQECKKEERLLNSTNAKIKYLTDLSRTQCSLVVVRHNDNKFKISVGDNILLGYSVFDLLKVSGIIIPNLQMGRELLYDGRSDFILPKEALLQLNEWLSEVHKWIDDFREINAALVGEGFVQLGQKPVYELLTSTRLPADVQDRVRDLPDATPCLLFNTVSINLEAHPYRDRLKAIYEEAYGLANLRARNGSNKKFLTGTYRSNIGAPQLERICPHLNKIIKVKHLADDFLGDGAFLSGRLEGVVGSPVEVFKQFKVGTLNDMARALMGAQYQKGATFAAISRPIDRLRKIAEIEGTSLALCEGYLREFTGLRFKPQAASVEISRAQKVALYEGSHRRVYTGGVRHKNIPALLVALRRAPALSVVVAEVPGVLETVAQLEGELMAKLNSYHTLAATGFYGKRCIDEGLDYLETYVAKIVYHDQSGVTEASIRQSLNVLAGIVGPDLVSGCSTGFAGRMNDLLLSLVSSASNDIEDAYVQFKHKTLQDAMAIARASGEGSMVVLRVNQELAPILGLDLPTAAPAVTRFRDLAPYTKQVLVHFTGKFNPVSVYHHIRKLLADRFWRLNNEGEDQAMYAFLKDLKLGRTNEELDAKYRVNKNPENRWQYSFFQQDLPKVLVQILLEKGILYNKSRCQEVKIMTPSGRKFLVGTGAAYGVAHHLAGHPAPRPPRGGGRPGHGFGYTPSSRVPAAYSSTSG